MQKELYLRLKQLEYYLAQAKGPLARMYWLGRLDELERKTKRADRQ